MAQKPRIQILVKSAFSATKNWDVGKDELEHWRELQRMLSLGFDDGLTIQFNEAVHPDYDGGPVGGVVPLVRFPSLAALGISQTGAPFETPEELSNAASYLSTFGSWLVEEGKKLQDEAVRLLLQDRPPNA